MFCPFRANYDGDTLPRAALCGHAASLCPGLQMCKPVGLSIAKTPYRMTVPHDRITRYGVEIDHATMSKSFNASVFQLEKMSSVVPSNRLACDDARISLLAGCMNC